MRLENRDKLFGGQVSRLQVAELVAAAVSNPDLAENKVGEVCICLISAAKYLRLVWVKAASFCPEWCSQPPTLGSKPRLVDNLAGSCLVPGTKHPRPG